MRHFYNKSALFGQVLDPALLLHGFTSYLFCYLSVCLVYLYCFVLCFSAGFVIGTCAVKSAR
jgi:hypothetical protein